MVSKAESQLFVTQFIKFTGVGVLGTSAHYVVLIALVQLLSSDAVIASSAGAIVGALVNYYFNYHFTFESTKRHADTITKFFSVAGVGFVLNGLLMALLTEKLSVHYLIAQIITTGILLIWNFLGNRFWTFQGDARGESTMERIPSNPPVAPKYILSFNSFWRENPIFGVIFAVATILLFWGVWWGWPLSYDQHDPTKKAIKMLVQRTLDPGTRYWGAFAYQEVLAFSVIPITLVKKVLSLDSQVSQGLMFLMTRIIFSLKALAMVSVTYFTSLQLFDNRRAALISMFLVAVSPGFLVWAHIPQVDIVHAFWYAMAVLFTAIGWKRNDIKFLWFAVLAAGLAAGVKYIGGIIVLAPVIVGLMIFPIRKALISGCLFLLASVFVFFLTTPLATGSPLQWLPEYTADVLANQHRELDKPIAFWTMPSTIRNLLGPGTALIGLIAAVFLFFSFRQSRSKLQPWWVLIACFLPYYLVLSWQHVSTVRYVIPLITVIAVATGVAMNIALEHKWAGRPIKWCFLLVGILQLLLSSSLVVGFSTDTRQHLFDWLEENTEPSDQVETILSHRPFFVSPPAFKVINRPHFQAETYQMQKHIMEDHDSSIRKIHDALIKFTGKDPQKLLTWVDKDRIWLSKKAKVFDTGLDGPAKRGSKYVVLNFNTAHFYILDWPGIDPESPYEKDFVQALIEESGPFKRVAEFNPIVPEWLRYPRELWFNISPPLAVYEVL